MSERLDQTNQIINQIGISFQLTMKMTITALTYWNYKAEQKQAPTDNQWQELAGTDHDLGMYSVVVSPAANTAAKENRLTIQFANIDNLAKRLDSLQATARLQSH